MDLAPDSGICYALDTFSNGLSAGAGIEAAPVPFGDLTYQAALEAPGAWLTTPEGGFELAPAIPALAPEAMFSIPVPPLEIGGAVAQPVGWTADLKDATKAIQWTAVAVAVIVLAWIVFK